MYNRAIFLIAAAGQAVNALPQAVTSAISPSQPAPSGCTVDFPSTFGLAVVTVGAASSSSAPAGPSAASVATESPDGQPGPASATTTPIPTATPVAQISDGQIQRQTTVSPVAQISDGQVQHQTTAAPVAQISDGQIQHQTTVAPITQISDGQVQATYSPVTVKSTMVSAQAVSQISDHQPQAPTSGTTATSVATSVYSTLVTSGVKPRSPATATQSPQLPATACRSKSSLTLSLNNGNLVDNEGRTGYIASNYQFQFDKPAQAGAIFTSGFSVCTDTSLLALGGTTTFYQCLSGDFYNLYDRDFGAGQCTPVNLQAIELQDC